MLVGPLDHTPYSMVEWRQPPSAPTTVYTTPAPPTIPSHTSVGAPSYTFRQWATTLVVAVAEAVGLGDEDKVAGVAVCDVDTAELGDGALAETEPEGDPDIEEGCVAESVMRLDQEWLVEGIDTLGDMLVVLDNWAVVVTVRLGEDVASGVAV
jgi:hypothetical protein